MFSYYLVKEAWDTNLLIENTFDMWTTIIRGQFLSWRWKQANTLRWESVAILMATNKFCSFSSSDVRGLILYTLSFKYLHKKQSCTQIRRLWRPSLSRTRTWAPNWLLKAPKITFAVCGRAPSCQKKFSSKWTHMTWRNWKNTGPPDNI
jgi:hypothetical protein